MDAVAIENCEHSIVIKIAKILPLQKPPRIHISRPVGSAVHDTIAADNSFAREHSPVNLFVVAI